MDGRNLEPAPTVDTSDAGGEEPFLHGHVLHAGRRKIVVVRRRLPGINIETAVRGFD